MTNKKTLVFTFGRMSPPTIGHEKVALKIKEIAAAQNGDAAIFLSHKMDKKKNLLTYSYKLRLAKKAFGNRLVHESDTIKNPLDVAREASGKYNRLVMVVGSDRVTELDAILKRYNEQEYKFDEIQVISAGERDPDADDTIGISSSKMRDAVKRGDMTTFKRGLPKRLITDAEEVFKWLRKT